MADGPTDIASSAAQSGIQAREIANARNATRANTANAVNRQIQAADEAESTVDTEDADTQIHTDAEGTGSQGRAYEEGGTGQEEAEAQAEDGVTLDEDGRMHLDLEA
ncbi:MAG: hypothetical protein JSU63_00935 [Phycisphaerales bacterium]|nr:MAG: hypothetical protein JSU63_00935 [Phycisphaerales bacterium]